MSAFNQVKDIYSTHIPVFSHSSKEDNGAALAVIFPSKVYSQKLPHGAFRTSPIPSLQALSGEPPLSIRRDQLALQFYYKLNSNIKNL